MMFPNGMSPDERRFHDLMVARDCTADKLDHKLTREAAESFEQFLAGAQRSADVVSIKREIR